MSSRTYSELDDNYDSQEGPSNAAQRRRLDLDEQSERNSEIAPEDSRSEISAVTVTCQKRQRSWVWSHFKSTEEKYMARCYIQVKKWDPTTKEYRMQDCGYTATHHPRHGLSNLSRHIEDKHNIDKNGPIQTANGQRQLNFGSGSAVKLKENFNLEGLRKRIILFVADCDLAFSLADRQSFRQILEFCNEETRYVGLGRTSISDSLNKIYIKYQRHVATILNSADTQVLHISTDCWASKSKDDYMGLAAQYVDKNFKMQTVFLGLKTIYKIGRHTGENLAPIYFSVMQEYGILGKHGTITTDSGSNNPTMVRDVATQHLPDFDDRQHHIRCFAHVLNLAAKDAIKQFGGDFDPEEVAGDEAPRENPMDLGTILQPRDIGQGRTGAKTINKRIHSLVIAVRGPTKEYRDQFRKFIECYQPEAHTHNLVLDVGTQWNSTFLMFERVLFFKKTLKKLATDDNTKELFSEFELTEPEWAQLEQLAKFLKPLHALTEEVCVAKGATSNLVIPIFLQLVKHLNELQLNIDYQDLQPSTIAMIDKLRKYLAISIKQRPLIAATILDPRRKLFFFEKHEQQLMDHHLTVATMRYDFENLASQFDKHEHTTPTAPSNPDAMGFALFDDHDNPSLTGLREEITSYLAAPWSNTKQDPLTFWAANQSTYPSLAAMAQYSDFQKRSNVWIFFKDYEI